MEGAAEEQAGPASIALRAAGALSAQLSIAPDSSVADLRALIAERMSIGPADAAALKLICGGTRLQVIEALFFSSG